MYIHCMFLLRTSLPFLVFKINKLSTVDLFDFLDYILHDTKITTINLLIGWNWIEIEEIIFKLIIVIATIRDI